MPLQYIPLNIYKCCEKYNIPNNKYINKNIYETFIDLIENTFCSFELIKGKNKKNLCGNKIKDGGKYCKRHNKFTIKNNNKEKYYCNSKSYRRSTCGRLVKGPNELCCFHKNNNSKDILRIDEKNSLSTKINNYNYIKDIINKGFDTNTLYNIIDENKRKRLLLNKFKFTCLFLMYNRKNKINDNIHNEDLGVKYYYHYIPKYTKIIEIPKISENTENLKIIIYNKYGYDAINTYTTNRIKKYIKNKKKKNKKKIKENIYVNVEKEYKQEEIEKIDYKNNILELKKLLNFISLKKNNNNIKEINIILAFIKNIKYNKHFGFYCIFIMNNIDKLLNLNNTNNVFLDDYKNKKVIIFNKKKDINLDKILIDIKYELNEIPEEKISWIGNKNGLYNYSNKYNINITKNGINIYKNDDKLQKHKLNIEQLIVFYC